MSALPSTDFRQRAQQYAEARIPKAKKNVLIYDNCSMHRSTTSTGGGNPPSRSKRRSAMKIKDDDMPPLAELDDEDDEDARTFSRFQRESSSWLVFSGVLALLVTLFITSFTANPLQPRVNSKEMARLLQQVNGQLHVMLGEMSRQGYDISSLQLDLGTQQEIRETFVTTIRDVWVPTLCYSSLIISLLGAMVCLQIKHWLMRCTMRFFPLSPAHPDPSSLRAAALRFVEYKKSRAETVARTKRIVIVVPPLMYGAAAMFACGVAAKIGSFFWIAIA